MHSFHYTNGSLHCEGVDLQDLAKQHGTPLYVYSQATIVDHFTRLDSALGEIDHLVCYATKANSNIAVLNLLAKRGAGFDIVSGGELYRVIKAGGDPSKCTFAGVGKTPCEIEYALEKNIGCFNAESEAEVRRLNEIAGKMGKMAPVALRVNPNVDAGTHKYISTGKSDNKFGIDYESIMEVYARIAKLPHIAIRGIQTHIGSQLTSVNPFVEAVKRLVPLVEELKVKYDISFFSIGGGIGIVYQDTLASHAADWWSKDSSSEGKATPISIEAYAEALLPLLKPLGLTIYLEPGRLIAGNAGVLLTEVLYEKKGSTKTFSIIDAGMNDLIRPALYQSHHDIAPVKEPSSCETVTVDIVGPVCESGDFFAQDRDLPPLAEGDVIAVLSAGAYGFVMASNYNSRPLPAEILVDGTQSHVIRKRQTYEDLTAGEMIPNS
jgi:diaminopimelate decarboxylase